MRRRCGECGKALRAALVPGDLQARLQVHARSGSVQQASRWFAVVLCGALLAACGSTPGSHQTSAAESRSGVHGADRGEAGGPEEPREELPLPPEAVQQFDAAVVHMNAGDDAAAEQAFRALAATYPAYSGALLNLGILQARAGRLQEAEQTFKEAIGRNGQNAAAFNQLGIVYRKLGHFEQADEAYQQAMRADPSYANAYLNLGVLCDLYLQQPERALGAYERYLELAPAPDARVSNWVNELKRRIGSDPSAARM